MPSPTYSVIIPAFIKQAENSGSILAGLLRAVRGVIATCPSPDWVELLVQDDASPGLTEWEGVLPGMVKYARNASNLGFAGNCNAGAARAKGRRLLFLNQDAYPLPNWYDGLTEAFNAAQEHGQRAAIVGPKLLFPPLEGQAPFPLRMQSCGGLYDAACHPFHRYLAFAENYPEANKCEEVSWITGAVHVWDRECFEAVGGYDPQYQGGYFEDVDACCRVQEEGGKRGQKWRVWYAPRARFFHQAGTSGGVKPDQFRSNAQLFWRRWVATGKVGKDVDVIQPDCLWW